MLVPLSVLSSINCMLWRENQTGIATLDFRASFLELHML